MGSCSPLWTLFINIRTDPGLAVSHTGCLIIIANTLLCKTYVTRTKRDKQLNGSFTHLLVKEM